MSEFYLTHANYLVIIFYILFVFYSSKRKYILFFRFLVPFFSKTDPNPLKIPSEGKKKAIRKKVAAISNRFFRLHEWTHYDRFLTKGAVLDLNRQLRQRWASRLYYIMVKF